MDGFTVQRSRGGFRMDGLVWEGGKWGRSPVGYFFLGLKRREDKVKMRRVAD